MNHCAFLEINLALLINDLMQVFIVILVVNFENSLAILLVSSDLFDDPKPQEALFFTIFGVFHDL